MRGSGQTANYRYVITVDRNDDPGTRVLTQGHRWRDDARLAYAFLILDARKKFRMPNDELPRIDTRSDRRAGVLQAVTVGPETITLRRRNPSDVDIAPPPDTIGRGKTGQLFTYTITAIFWGSVCIYAGVEYGYKSLIEFLTWIIGFFAVIGAVAAVLGLAARGVSALRHRLMETERGRHVEYVVRRGSFYLYVVLITPVLVLISIAFAVGMLKELIDIWITTPMQLAAAIVVGIRTLGHWIGIW